MAKIVCTQHHNSGIPLGGIGTGSVEVRPDGHFHEWQIFNLGVWAPHPAPCCAQVESPPMGTDSLAFFLRVDAGGAEPLVRHLGARPDFANNYSTPWLNNVDRVEFDGRFPVAGLRYEDERLPVEMTARVLSPFIPHDAERSGTPGFYVAFRLRNTGRERVNASVLGLLQNPLAWGAEDRMLTNTVERQAHGTRVLMQTGAASECPATSGSMCFCVRGGEASYIAGEYRRFMKGYVPEATGMARSHEVVFHRWRRTGKLPDCGAAKPPTTLGPLTAEAVEAMTAAERRQVLDRLREHAFAADLLERMAQVDAGLLGSDEGVELALENVSHLLDRLARRDRVGQDWGDVALSSSVGLDPGEGREVRFVVAWHFPHLLSEEGKRLGHRYENRFADAGEVAAFLAESEEELRARTEEFARTLYETTEDEAMADAWSAQLSTLVKSTWWTKDGEFGVWEGLGCCGFHTTDITYQGSFGILALFPELQMRQMQLGARFQREDGRVHHLLRPDLEHVDEGYDRVDMNQQFVLLVCRDYLWTGDRQYLEGMWPHVVRAMDCTLQIDGDGDGLPDRDTRRNTYDAWDFTGTPAYVSSLWLSALLAGSRLAEEMGDAARADEWRGLLSRARERFDELLWNGQYYSLWVDGDRRDECCMTDQVSGEWFTSVSGLGHVLSGERVRAALAAVMQHNFSPEAGLRNAVYPPGRQPRLQTHGNFQATGCWTGIEYAMASMLIEFGMVQQAREVVRSVHERQARSGRLWNHMECGDHYYRAMSSWSVLLSLTGFRLDVPRGTVTFAPAADGDFRAPWVAPTGWGTFGRSADGLKVECAAGSLRWKALRCGVPAGELRAQLDGEERAVTVSEWDRGAVLEFADAAELRAGGELVVR
jgi:uncharacterized protein (DUF608 family)